MRPRVDGHAGSLRGRVGEPDQARMTGGYLTQQVVILLSRGKTIGDSGQLVRPGVDGHAGSLRGRYLESRTRLGWQVVISLSNW